MNLVQKVPTTFKCIICHYNTCRKSQYERHLLTAKHKILTNPNEKVQDDNFFCNCGKKYKHMSSLCNHKKNCKKGINKDNENSINQIVELFHQNIKENKELKDMLVQQNKNILEFASNNNITNNNITNNNNFNLQIFLNEKCKDAPNLIDFINSIQLKLSDFENFGTFGYADNISRILLREIKDVDIYKRPIHCSDLKREVIHVKDENAWKKDEDKMHMKKAIKEIAYKNFKTIIPEWIKENPESKDITSKKHDQYIKMMSNSMGEVTEEGDEKNYNKIIRTVAKEILVDKDK